MWFLARLVFWLGATVLLLSRVWSLHIRSTPEAVISDGLTTAILAISDMRQFCSAQPTTCETGSQIIVEFGRETQLRAKAVIRLLNKPVNIGAAAGAEVTRPSQNTLLPADVKAPWHVGPTHQVGPRPTARARDTQFLPTNAHHSAETLGQVGGDR